MRILVDKTSILLIFNYLPPLIYFCFLMLSGMLFNQLKYSNLFK